MTFDFSKSHIALGLAGAVASFVAVGLVMHSRALPVSMPPVSAAPVADAAPTPQANAQPLPRPEARTPDQQAGPHRACRQDVRQLCGDVTPGAGRIARCLVQHRSEISEGCRTAMQQRRMERQQRQTNGAGYGQPRMQPSARIISVPNAQSSVEE